MALASADQPFGKGLRMSIRELRNFVNGQYVESAASEQLDIVNPATEEVYARTPVSTEADVASAYSAAATAF